LEVTAIGSKNIRHLQQENASLLLAAQRQARTHAGAVGRLMADLGQTASELQQARGQAEQEREQAHQARAQARKARGQAQQAREQARRAQQEKRTWQAAALGLLGVGAVALVGVLLGGRGKGRKSHFNSSSKDFLDDSTSATLLGKDSD
jgi:hypothetical protein